MTRLVIRKEHLVTLKVSSKTRPRYPQPLNYFSLFLLAKETVHEKLLAPHGSYFADLCKSLVEKENCE
ncbi:hypothetical protein Y032_0233g3118 [Ancylostoma ceylanicum]|nr:hypothetical protein Y032_0233g3118 [Ancylostoma ceylanicum]